MLTAVIRCCILNLFWGLKHVRHMHSAVYFW